MIHSAVSPIPTLVLKDDQWNEIPGLPASRLTPEAEALVIGEVRGGVFGVKRRKPWIIGRVQVGDRIVEVPSKVPGSLLVPMICYADGLSTSDALSILPSADDPEDSGILVLLAKTFLRITTQKLGQDAARQYITIEERQQLLKGRPLWIKSMGRHPAEGITCRYHQLSTDIPVNQIILDGLECAQWLVRGVPSATRLANQAIEYWRQVASPRRASPEAMASAINELPPTLHRYRLPLELARSLILRRHPDPFQNGRNTGTSMTINLANLLEKLLERMLNDFLVDYPHSEVVPQETDRTCFFDGKGDRYKDIQPDLLIKWQGRPVAIIDAKFKPKYVDVPPGDQIPPKHRVSTSDLFQMAFYQARINSVHGKPPHCAIVAPMLGPGPVPRISRRTIAWESASDAASTRVIPLSLPELAQILRNPGSDRQPIDAAPELKALVIQALNEASSTENLKSTNSMTY